MRTQIILKPATLAEMLPFTKPDDDYNRANGLGIFKDFPERAPDELPTGTADATLATPPTCSGSPTKTAR